MELKQVVKKAFNKDIAEKKWTVSVLYLAVMVIFTLDKNPIPLKFTYARRLLGPRLDSPRSLTGCIDCPSAGIIPSRMFNSPLSFEFSLLSLLISSKSHIAGGAVAAFGDKLEERNCSLSESVGEFWTTATGATARNGCTFSKGLKGATGPVEALVELCRRLMSPSIAFLPRQKQSCANSCRSGSIIRNPGTIQSIGFKCLTF
ncbi:protein kinase superfamily protein [Striga asiatica]|uniref:Protein kinase superfamily protein n=1 Tax=Striga asiatica TaxID=4170 RepID=A0A5A7Q2I6_STRAF|nr:protein kinase superfamily protein [Striga asiatica]